MNKVMPKYFNVAACALLSITLLSGLALSSSSVSADDDSVVDEINITVPSSCNLTGIGNTSHTATINNGTYVSDIGTTTIKAFCNDQEGFAIYAIGYTDDTDGKNVLTSSVLGSTHDIATGTGTSGNSQWAMKLSTQTSPEPDYPITIQNSFDSFHTVPDDYTLVAKRTASTDVGTNAIGSTLTSTYQVYISQTQSAGTYVGQVKYVMVHPHGGDKPKPQTTRVLEVTYDTTNTRLFFDPEKTQTQNTVTYSAICNYEVKQSVILRTSNLDEAGIQNGSYVDNLITYSRLFHDASKIKVVVNYGFTANTGGVMIVGDDNQQYEIYSEEDDLSGTATYVLNGGMVHVDLATWGTENLVSDYDYGAYITIYPLDENNNEIPFTEYSNCSYTIIGGEYLSPDYVEPTPGGYYANFGGWLYAGEPNPYLQVGSLIQHLIEELGLSDSVTVTATTWY